MNWDSIKDQLKDFLKNEVEKTGYKKVVLGLSGGLDSAVVAILCKEVFEDNMSVVIMPSKYSSKSSIDDALELCTKFNIKHETVNITPMINAYFSTSSNASSLRIGNYSARMRMSVLYDISARDDALVIGTSNKSELLLGYGTIFGDIACAINPLGELYKSDEFHFAKHIGVTDAIINKKPSADLWDGQSDEEELGYTYATMDEVLKEIIENKQSKDTLIDRGYNKNLLSMLLNRIQSNKFKGELPIIAKINFANKGK